LVKWGLNLAAKSSGAWGKKLRATIDVEVSEEMRTRLGLGASDALFNQEIPQSLLRGHLVKGRA
jgi:hypothetical protein